MPRVLITGAAGFIGMHTAIHFLKEGWAVVGIDNFNEYYSSSLKRDRVTEIAKVAKSLRIEFLMKESDLNSDIWRNLHQLNIDAVVHLAAQAGVRYSIENPRAYLESNILGFQSVLEFVNENKIHKFLYASSSSVYGKNSTQPFLETESCNMPESYYAATKKSNELMAYAYYKTKGQSSLGLRFFTVYGPWGRPDMAPHIFLEKAFKRESIDIFNYGRQKRDFTFVDDVVDAIYKLTVDIDFSDVCNVLNIGRGQPTKLMDFVLLLEQHLEQDIIKNLVKPQPGDVEETYASTMNLSHYVPELVQTSLDEGIDKFVKWFRDYYGK
jgi:UDP-glucuronate 4-epimerase